MLYNIFIGFCVGSISACCSFEINLLAFFKLNFQILGQWKTDIDLIFHKVYKTKFLSVLKIPIYHVCRLGALRDSHIFCNHTKNSAWMFSTKSYVPLYHQLFLKHFIVCVDVHHSQRCMWVMWYHIMGWMVVWALPRALLALFVEYIWPLGTLVKNRRSFPHMKTEVHLPMVDKL